MDVSLVPRMEPMVGTTGCGRNGGTSRSGSSYGSMVRTVGCGGNGEREYFWFAVGSMVERWDAVGTEEWMEERSGTT